MDDRYRNFIESVNVMEDIEKKSSRFTYICGACNISQTEDFPVYTIADIGRVCRNCYRDTNLQAMIFQSLMGDG